LEAVVGVVADRRRIMNINSSSAPNRSLAFSAWKLLLRNDCEARGKLVAFESLGDYALQLLWEEGIDPSVEAIVRGLQQNPPD